MSETKPATDEQLKIWQERPCGDTQCRCTELHLDQAIARIEADAAIKADLLAACEAALRIQQRYARPESDSGYVESNRSTIQLLAAIAKAKGVAS